MHFLKANISFSTLRTRSSPTQLTTRSLPTLSTARLQEIQTLGQITTPTTLTVPPNLNTFTTHLSSLASTNPFAPLSDEDTDTQPPDTTTSTYLHKNTTPSISSIHNNHSSSPTSIMFTTNISTSPDINQPSTTLPTPSKKKTKSTHNKTSKSKKKHKHSNLIDAFHLSSDSNTSFSTNSNSSSSDSSEEQLLFNNKKFKN